MIRLSQSPRHAWRTRVENVGLSYHSHENGPYWDESVCYEFAEAEILALESATNTLHKLCLDAAEQIILRDWWHRLHIPEAAKTLIIRSWEQDDFSLYGRFDLAYDGQHTPRLLEYNADTPTALLEASVAQWFWLQECHPGMDQFNSLHDRLIAAWKRRGPASVHFASVRDHEEDSMTVRYLRDTCLQAGMQTHEIALEDLGWDHVLKRFVDLDGMPVESCFKLYPWEWMYSDLFASHLEQSRTRFLEPAWKMLLSNKAILPILWELYPEHPNLLPAFDTPEPLGTSYVQKPIFGREGANVAIHLEGKRVLQSEGIYADSPSVFQALAPTAQHDGNYPVLGLWVVDHEAAGLGIREDNSMITGNLSRFIPHFFRPS